ncbi:MAG: phosphotransferase [Pseudomonadota bacterium]
MLDHSELCRLIPHTGRMCLLDQLLSWDHESLVCLSHSHRRGDNPLRDNGQLAGIHAVEYGAQAMAVHGGLMSQERGEPIRPGFLVSLRNVELWVERLDLIESPLTVSARQLLADSGNLLYRFAVHADGSSIAKGQLAVMVQRERSY